MNLQPIIGLADPCLLVPRHAVRGDVAVAVGRSVAFVRFLADGESLQVAGVECGIHGHAGPDGSRGSVAAFDRLGMDMVIGHFHQPAIRGSVHVAGTCQLDLGYGRGPTSWAVAHVVVHDDGGWQHVFLGRGRFAA